MPKDNFGNDSRFNKGVGNKKPLKKLIDNNLPDVNPLSDTPKKTGQDVNKLSDTPVKTGLDVNKLSDTPEKTGQDVNKLSDTPQKIGQDVNKLSDTPQKTGQDVNKLSDTPDKITMEVSPFSNLSKLENEGVGVDAFVTNNLSDIKNLSPINDSDLLKPFNKSNLSGLDNFSPTLDNDKIGEVDFFNNTNAPGFVKNFDEGSVSKYIEDSSNRTFTPLNRYEDSINSNPDGNFSDIQIENALQSSNPLPQGHLESIGNIDTEVSQEVDFFGGDNSYFPTLNPAIVGFSKMFTAGDGSLLIENQDMSSLDNLLNYRTFDFSSGQDPENLQAMYENYVYDPRTPRIGVPSFTMSGVVNRNIYLGSGLDSLTDNNNNMDNKYEDNPDLFADDITLEKLFNSRNYDFRSERNIFSQLSADGASLGSGGQRKIKFYNSPNSYLGSNLDDLSTPQLSPFVGGVNDYRLISQYIGSIEGAPYFNPDDYFVQDGDNVVGTALENSGYAENSVTGLTKKYDEYKFDPRRRDIFPSKWYNSQNPYYGSIFDDPIVDNVEGGGVFNSSNSPYAPSASIYGASPPSPSMKEIADSGNFGNYAPGRYTSVGSLNSSKNAIEKYEQSSLVNFPLTELGSNLSGYYSGPSIPGEEGSNFEGINLSNSSWWVTGEIAAGIPVTNTYLESRLSDDVPSAGSTRTVSISGIDLTSNRLGYGDLTFETLYTNSDVSGSTGLYDTRLNMRYTTLTGPRGFEPYVVKEIPANNQELEDARSNSYLFDTIGINSGVYNQQNEDRVASDLDRFESFFATNAGTIFLEKHEINFRKNPRSYRGFRRSAIDNSIRGKFGYYTNVKNLIELDVYTGTVYETLLRPFGLNLPAGISHPGEIANTALFITNNLRQLGVNIPYLGGNAFQALGFNRLGFTDKTNVAPTSLETLLDDNIANAVMIAGGLIFGKSALQTDAGGMSEFTNPRYLGYTQKIGPFNILGDHMPEHLIDEKVSARLSKINPRRRADHKKLPGQSIKLNAPIPFLHSGASIDLTKSPSPVQPFKSMEYNHIPDDQIGADIFAMHWGIDEKYEKTIMNTYTDTGEPVYSPQQPLTMDPHKFGIGSNQRKGDFHNLVQWGVRKDEFNYEDTLEKAHPNDKYRIESESAGFPFYFKDLRDNTWIFFRGYVNGLTEQISPKWSEQVFLGRSEPVFHYEMATRDITFTLKLYAQTRDELDILYDKLDRLASLCYPEYSKDEVNFKSGMAGSGKIRPKPPLTKFRMAELFGSRDNELSGFIKSLSNVYPDTSPWETHAGHRVPLYVESTITYQVIHKETPNVFSKFYGKPYSNGEKHPTRALINRSNS